EFLSKVSKAYMSLVGKGKENIFCENSLDLPQNWSKETLDKIKLNEFDILFTNPPFGSKIKIKEKKILEQYELGHRWTKTNKGMEKTSILLKSQTPQILFIERCLQLLKDGGRMAIVLPEGLLGNPSHEYIRSFIIKNSKILAVIDAPKETFLPNTQTKTCILFLQKGKTHKNDYEIFMAIAEKCGHDSRDNIIYKIDKKGNLLYDNLGNKIIDDDFPEICKNYSRFIQDEPLIYNRKGFKVKISELKSLSLIPRFYDPFINEELKKLSKNYDLVRIKDLIKKGIISIRKGQGIEKKYYGTGDIPYVRTSDIVNWELKIDPSKSVSNEIYEKLILLGVKITRN
ncbi:MAG: HsdM family class I SAM-dependent methyltransferase, partial [Promethearchaeota archaeon]